MKLQNLAIACTLALTSSALADETAHCAKGAPHAAAAAPASPYAGEQGRVVKSLSDDDTKSLLSGAGMGLAKPAELNHYPGPKHVIELADELKLDDRQLADAHAAFETMREEATAIGSELVEKEGALDRLFASGRATDDTVAAATIEIGALQGRLRATHLRAHLRMREIMTPEQVAAYDTIRGYRN